MKTEKSTLKTEAVFSNDGKHRFLLHKEWDKKKSSAMVIMINPNTADTLNIDLTTQLVVNNLSQLGFGNVYIVNLYSVVTEKIHFRFCSDEELLDTDNDKIIAETALKADKIIIAWGAVGKNNTRVQERQEIVLEMLSDFKDKLFQISDEAFHPLVPSVRNHWELKPYKEVYHAEN